MEKEFSLYEPVIVLDFLNINTRLRHDQPARFLRKGVRKEQLGLIFVEVSGVILEFPEARVVNEADYKETGRRIFDYK